MKLDFKWNNDGEVHSYCIICHSEAVERKRVEGKTQYYCQACDKMYDRWIKIDPGVNWWVDVNGEYWHESSGVFVRNSEGKFLFFKRSVFPFSLTVPSGHVDTGESALFAADRELDEEVGLIGNLREIGTEDIVGDSCSRGSDAHKWHAFLLEKPDVSDVHVREEGDSPVWITLTEALAQGVTPPVKYIIERYSEELVAA